VFSVVPAWVHGIASQRRALLIAYGVNAVLNVLWSALFFAWRRPDWALAEVGLLWLSVASLLVVSRHRPLSVVLLLPYLLWLTVAATLNYSVVQLNGPFAGALAGAVVRS
jgi:tryptophan-rich sensory protein